MSCPHHEDILLDLFDEVLAEFYHSFNAGEMTLGDLEKITRDRFEDLN
tara:strand:+ start:40 stop:183 length:144 start_codon:yes stop_codon:yes gene_type:complete